jgi:hypothetical protein
MKVTAHIEKKYNEKEKLNIFQNTKWKPEYVIEINNSSTYLKKWKII